MADALQENRYAVINVSLGHAVSVVPIFNILADTSDKHETWQYFHQAVFEWTSEGGYNAGLATGILILLILKPYSKSVLDGSMSLPGEDSNKIRNIEYEGEENHRYPRKDLPITVELSQRPIYQTTTNFVPGLASEDSWETINKSSRRQDLLYSSLPWETNCLGLEEPT